MSTSSVIEYQGFKADLQFDQDDEFIVVRIIGLPIAFHARNRKAAEEELRRLVDQGLSKTISPGEQALFEKEYSGNVALRIGPLLHQDLALAAHRAGKSLNRYMEEKLQLAIELEALGKTETPAKPTEKPLPESVRHLIDDTEAGAELFQEIQGCLKEKINFFQFPTALKNFLISFGESLDEIEPYVKKDKLEEFMSAIARLIQTFNPET